MSSISSASQQIALSNQLLDVVKEAQVQQANFNTKLVKMNVTEAIQDQKQATAEYLLDKVV